MSSIIIVESLILLYLIIQVTILISIDKVIASAGQDGKIILVSSEKP